MKIEKLQNIIIYFLILCFSCSKNDVEDFGGINENPDYRPTEISYISNGNTEIKYNFSYADNRLMTLDAIIEYPEEDPEIYKYNYDYSKYDDFGIITANNKFKESDGQWIDYQDIITIYDNKIIKYISNKNSALMSYHGDNLLQVENHDIRYTQIIDISYQNGKKDILINTIDGKLHQQFQYMYDGDYLKDITIKNYNNGSLDNITAFDYSYKNGKISKLFIDESDYAYEIQILYDDKGNLSKIMNDLGNIEIHYKFEKGRSNANLLFQGSYGFWNYIYELPAFFIVPFFEEQPEWEQMITINLNIIDELKVPGNSVFFRSDNIIIYCKSQGTYFAFDATCTYEDSNSCIIKNNGQLGTCPCCNSQFSFSNGGFPIKGQASEKLKSFETKLNNDNTLTIIKK